MRIKFFLFVLSALFAVNAFADTDETITISGTAVSNFATRITFNGDNVTLSYADGTSQTEVMDNVKIDFSYIAQLSEENGFDNETTLKTFGKRTVNVNVVRSLKKDQWNTICLPFDMPAASVVDIFGTGTKVAEYDADNGTTINFNTVEDMLCGVPYLIQPAEDVAEFTLENIMLNNVVSGNTVLGTNFHFVGTILDEIPEGNVYYFANGNKVKKLAQGSTIKPFHAYLSSLNESSISSFSIDEETLGIENVNYQYTDGGLRIYNLGGQFMGTSTVGLNKGVYIVNGKKVVVK